MKVRANAIYVYSPNMLDQIDGRTNLKAGDLVRVKNLHGCPRCNTMGHCHVVNVATGEFIGLIHTNSLHTREAWAEFQSLSATEVGTTDL